MNEHNSPLTSTSPFSSTPLDEPNKNGRRVSKKALGLLAAAAVSAGTIGSVTLMSNTSAADTPTTPPATVEIDDVEPTAILPITIEDLDTEAPGSVDYESWDTDDHNWDDCPACGMG